jgi:hypothetical protein
MPMNKKIFKRYDRWIAFLTVLPLMLIICLPAQGQRGGGGGGGGGGRGGGGGMGDGSGGGRSRFPISTPEIPVQPGAQRGGTSKVDLRGVENRITANIFICPLQKALQELADWTGIIFELRSNDTPNISVKLDKVPLEEAIQRIAPEHNILFYYEQDKPEGRITKVSIYPRTPAIQQPGIMYLGSGTITRTNDDISTPEQAVRALAEGARLEIKQKAIAILVSKNNKNEETIKALTGALADQDAEIRVTAIGHLAAFRVRDALPEIIKCLKDENPGVKKSAIAFVALLGNDKNIQDLKPLIADKDRSVASEAEVAIRNLSRK